MAEQDSQLQARYDELWSAARTAFQRGQVAIDPHLGDKASDRRRGLSVIIRPAPAVAEQVTRFLQELACLEPEQYYYRGDELHVTVLSLFTSTPDYQPQYERLAAYMEAVDRAVAGAIPFTIRFAGVTAAPGAVLMQGYPDSSQLACLRERLRASLRKAGLGDGLDERYRLATAHMTAMRFATQPRALPALVETLTAYRTHTFGGSAVTELLLVKNDWYMSAGRVHVVKRYRLG